LVLVQMKMGSEQEMPLTIGRDAYELNEALLSVDDDMLVSESYLLIHSIDTAYVAFKHSYNAIFRGAR
jgi:hypothetical protein